MGTCPLRDLRWLPEQTDWRPRLRTLAGAADDVWPRAVAMAGARLDFTRTNALDDVVQRTLGGGVPTSTATPPVRLALLGSATMAHLHAPIRVAAMRRNIFVSTYENNYGQYWQELLAPNSALHAFRPDTVLLAIDSRHLAREVHAAMSAAEVASAVADAQALLLRCWRAAQDWLKSTVLQQTLLDVFPRLMGSNEHRLPGSRSHFISELNALLPAMADAEGVHLVAVDHAAACDGLTAWHDPALWHRSKQEISPAAGPAYGEIVARLIAARHGRSHKCLVLDLDNTLWGGVIGDDGPDGIVIGQGSPLGEGFVAVQEYAKELARRGVILAVCSKNDEANAREPFEKHPDMVLRLTDIASFHANWEDKPANLRAIAADLNIGLDSLVFLDDNPFERNLVREALPMVAVPEISDDPAEVPAVLADAGYFESLGITEEDRARTAQYQENRAREVLRGSSTDLESYLRGLDMRMRWSRFDHVGQPRIVQLINKTNQFNLTTRRYTDADVAAIASDPDAVGVQIRLLDRFGDNGIIAIVILRRQAADTMLLDTWLMSCRVLGRQVESTTLNLVAQLARDMGARRLVGEYIPTTKNAMVRDHYEKLGFAPTLQEPGGRSLAELSLDGWAPVPTFIAVSEGQET